ncbi:helix-turn-helix transcriptional regulator [Nocardia sp. NPDC052254]|uniref:helix-turn-helix domain-containing protein n=1 Tax=Nocardia sp. NPDC052254 TaxID=3155681 RepID=UPI003416E2B6
MPRSPATSVVRNNLAGHSRTSYHTSRKLASDQKTKTVSRWETGESEPTAAELVRLSDVLGVSHNTLVGRAASGLYFELHPHGQMMAGVWAGQSYVAPVVFGWCAVAANAVADTLVHEM